MPKEEKNQDRDGGRYSNKADQPGRTQAAGEANQEEVRKAAATVPGGAQNAAIETLSVTNDCHTLKRMSFSAFALCIEQKIL
jgi:hypothetical protein